jgi:hypothetical protein
VFYFFLTLAGVLLISIFFALLFQSKKRKEKNVKQKNTSFTASPPLCLLANVFVNHHSHICVQANTALSSHGSLIKHGLPQDE